MKFSMLHLAPVKTYVLNTAVPRSSTVNLPKRESGLENFCTLFSSEDLTRTKIAPGIRIRPQKR